jgi:hypothetical protein
VFDCGYALVDIQKGEEITCNYFEFDPSFTGFGHGDGRGSLRAAAREPLKGRSLS